MCLVFSSLQATTNKKTNPPEVHKLNGHELIYINTFLHHPCDMANKQRIKITFVCHFY